MHFLLNLKIKTRLNIILIGIVVLVMFVIALYLNGSFKNQLEMKLNNEMSEQLKDLVRMIDIQVQENQNKVNMSIKMAHYYFYSQGSLQENKSEKVEMKAENQITHDKISVNLSGWKLGKSMVHNSLAVVDSIHLLGVESVTIFQKIDQGFIRISTTVERSDGSRAIGTYIPNESPVVQTVIKGETYRGRAFVVSDWYLTAYEPIYIDREIKGMLYVGVREKNLTVLKEILKNKKYMESGFPFLVNQSGEMIIHPAMEGKLVENEPFFKKLTAVKDNSVLEVMIGGEKMVQFIHYFDPVKTYVVIQVPKAEIYSTIRHLGTVLLISFIVAILLIIGAIYMIGRQISDQLNKSVVFAKQIADGDMNANIQINTKDEIGQLSSALKEMTARLKEIISVISSGTENIASASEELSSSAESLSGSANEQASSLEEISSSIDQLVQNIRKSADNSKGINSITGNIVSDMQMVGNASTKSMDAISKISQKITIINDIAFQTNLLALNAAVEAARAGEHGRGFAVVAAEVRKLAERSKQAAEEINQLAGETISLTSQTESLIQKVIPEIKQASLMIDEITNANIEESDGTTQINTGVQQLNRTTQHNASSSEQLAGSAEELANQASQLKELMSYFKV